MQDQNVKEWIYTYFTISWDIGKGGRYPSSNEQIIRHNEWGRDQANLLSGIQKYIDDGWQPLTEIGPAAYLFRRNGSFLEFAAFRVKLRRPKPTEFHANKTRFLGKWHVTEVKGRGLNKFVMGLAGMAGGIPKEMMFLPDNSFNYGKHSGLYLIYEEDIVELSFYEVLDTSIFPIIYDLKWNGNNSLELHARNKIVNSADIYLQRA